MIEGEHDLIFKQILDQSEFDQNKIEEFHENLQILIQRIMNEKNSVKFSFSFSFQIEIFFYLKS